MDGVWHLLGRDDLTIDDVVDLPEGVRYELIDGRFIPVRGIVPIDQHWMFNIWTALDENAPDHVILNHWQMILLDPRNELRPDVMAIRVEGANRSPVYPSDVPVLVEVLTEWSAEFDRGAKRNKYAKAGIQHYWILDPLEDRAVFTQFVLVDGGRYECRLETDERVTVMEPWEVTLDLPAWTREYRRDLKMFEPR